LHASEQENVEATPLARQALISSTQHPHRNAPLLISAGQIQDTIWNRLYLRLSWILSHCGYRCGNFPRWRGFRCTASAARVKCQDPSRWLFPSLNPRICLRWASRAPQGRGRSGDFGCGQVALMRSLSRTFASARWLCGGLRLSGCPGPRPNLFVCIKHCLSARLFFIVHYRLAVRLAL
jgi:hypothetical protein